MGLRLFVLFNLLLITSSVYAGGGVVSYPLQGIKDTCYSVALTPDGRLLLTGSSSNSQDSDFGLLFLKPDGEPDAKFGRGGAVVTDFGNDDQAYAGFVQADGKVIAAGAAFTGKSYDIAVARFLPDGQLDKGFSGKGKFTRDLSGGDDKVYAVALQPDQKILLTGSTQVNGSNQLFVMRLLPGGLIDNSFGKNGVTTLEFGRGEFIGYSLAIQADGKILVGGNAKYLRKNNVLLTRLDARGKLDEKFGKKGNVMASFGALPENSTSMALQSDGKVVVGSAFNTQRDLDFMAARFHADGGPDLSFGQFGKVSTPVGKSNDMPFAVALQADGKIVVGGAVFDGWDFDFALTRYTPTGKLDTSFGEKGVVSTRASAGYDAIYSLAINSENEIFAAGVASRENSFDFAIAKYRSDGTIDRSFGASRQIASQE